MTKEYNRRDFLKQNGIAGAGLLLGCSFLCSCSNLRQSKEREGKTMEKMIAYCGLRCDTCRILLATREKNDEKKYKMRADIARYIREHFDPNCKVEDITDCDGCKTQGGRLFSGCSKCQVRKCAIEKGVENCAYCKEYACENLEKLFTTEADAKANLEEIRKSL
jgi:hypothetical protein